MRSRAKGPAKRSRSPARPAPRTEPVALVPGPIVFPGVTRTQRRRIKELVARGALTAIGPRLLIRSDIKDVAQTVRDHWASIASRLFPGALISHRTALEFRPTSKGEVFLTATTNRVVTFPGIKLVFLRGAGPLPDDIHFIGARASSPARALLENLSISRGREKNLARDSIERRLEQVLRDGGEAALNALRDRAREIAHELEWEHEGERLDAIIGALLGTRFEALASNVGRARASGSPYDERCLDRLGVLAGELRRRTLPSLRDERGFGEHFRNKAFFDAYFSNYIEGTTFELSEAESIVFEHQIPARRPEDAHDITGTFDIVSDPNEMRRVPRNPDELHALLQSRHAVLMAKRLNVLPGEFKTTINRAGDTVFVHPDYVRGTLDRGCALLVELEPGLQRAIFVMFLVSEVHPFNDGNGRIARIMMNAELVAASSTTILIPTVYREEYVDTLRALTRQQRPAPIVDMLIKAQRFSNLDFSDYGTAVRHMETHNWFREPGPFKLVF